MIFLWGPIEDDPIRAVHDALHRRRCCVVHLDDARPQRWRLRGAAGHLMLCSFDGGYSYSLADVTGCYARPYSGAASIDAGPVHPSERRHLALIDQQLWHWAATMPGTVLNRPGPSATNGTKTSQTRCAQQLGFAVPPSLVTTDADAVRDFVATWKTVIYKGNGGMRTIVERIDIHDTDRLTNLRTCPTYLQAFIPGVCHRVHLVGERLFVTAVESDRVDYRYGSCTMSDARLPDDVADRCRQICAWLALPLAGIDLIRGEDGEWYFLEANTSPAFTAFPDEDRVAAAIADLLATQI